MPRKSFKSAWIKPLPLVLGVLSAMSAHAALSPMPDQDLSGISGRDSLLTMNVINPGQSGNPNGNVGFYKLTVNAKMEMNANARRVQLGCGGINGADGCDIDINYLRFVGLGAVDANGKPINDKGPSTDFEQINPFFEMAIANPDSPTGRKIVGMRFGAEQARGILSNGTRPVDANNNPISINRTPVTYDTGLGTVTNELYDPNEHTGVNQLSAVIDRLVVTNGTVPIKVNILGIKADATGKIMEGGPCNNNPSKCESYMLGQRLDANGNLIKNTTSNVFEKVYFARASTMRLAPLNIEISSSNALADGKKALADMKSDSRFLHNMQVGTPTSYANDFYFSFSTLGNNDVWSTLGWDHGPERTESTNDAQRMADYANVVNSPNPSAVGSWLNWRSANGNWTPMMRGWALHLPEIMINNFTTPLQNASGIDALISPDKANLNDNLDIQQVPVDNCYGTLKFC